MKRVIDDPRRPECLFLEKLDRFNTVEEDVHLYRQLGLPEAGLADFLRESAERRYPDKFRRRRGRPAQDLSNNPAFRLAVVVHNELCIYRRKLGVKRVPAAETSKIIACIMQWAPHIGEEAVREQLRKNAWLMPDFTEPREISYLEDQLSPVTPEWTEVKRKLRSKKRNDAE